MKYLPTIGLEVHAELKTKTKMFCSCLNDPLEKKPNVNICPICLAHPGTLPAINQEAVRTVLRVGLALGGKLADFTEFDRKNYFYPDIPKGYQISQYKYPLVGGGSLRGIALTRVHLEEDTARSIHDAHDEHSLVDFNRAGLPLMELVTEPVITSAKAAGDFARELQLILRTIGASEANMEQGQMRVEANISLRPEGQKDFGTKVEVKNLNSFRIVERAIDYELKRQAELLERGEKVVQETRGWDEGRQETFSQRQKESSHDYRYFPDPDLPKLFISQIADFADLEKTLPELPEAKRQRYRSDYGLKTEDIEAYVVDQLLGDYFDALAKILAADGNLVKLASNYLTSDFLGLQKSDPKVTLPPAQEFADLITMTAAGEISSRGAKDLLLILATEGGMTRTLAVEQGLLQKSDENFLTAIVEQVITTHPGPWADYQGGNDKALQFLIGQAMKESKGAAHPGLLAKSFAAKK